MRLKLLVITVVMVWFAGSAKAQYTCTTYPCYLCIWGPPLTVEVPNIFTPNYDLVNDVWKPKVQNDLCITEYKATIFNRWGKLIFETFVHSTGWNGNEVTGEHCPDGSYYYIVSYSSGYTRETKTYKGFVELVR